MIPGSLATDRLDIGSASDQCSEKRRPRIPPKEANGTALFGEIQNGAGVWELIKDELDLGVEHTRPCHMHRHSGLGE